MRLLHVCSILTFALLIVLVGCASESDHEWGTNDCAGHLLPAPSDRIICYSGVLDEALVAVVSNASNTVEALSLKTPGGDIVQSMRLAQAIRDRDLALYIQGDCRSACPLLLLHAARSLHVRSDTIFSLHGNAIDYLSDTTGRISDMCDGIEDARKFQQCNDILAPQDQIKDQSLSLFADLSEKIESYPIPHSRFDTGVANNQKSVSEFLRQGGSMEDVYIEFDVNQLAEIAITNYELFGDAAPRPAWSCTANNNRLYISFDKCEF